MRILMASGSLSVRRGGPLYVRDLAIGLLARGHEPVAYAPALGDVAGDLHAAGITLIQRLEEIAEPIDVIHGHNNFETMLALLHFPGVPGIYTCHGPTKRDGAPPLFPRVVRYLAVDHACRARLEESGIPPEQITVVLNFVELERFVPREALPVRPGKALVFSNNHGYPHFPFIQAACARAGMSLDVVGVEAQTAVAHPEVVLPAYDLVFAKARCALEALAVGTAVIICDRAGVGPMVTSDNFERLRRLNFGLRTMTEPPTLETLERQIARYDAADAARVSRHVRATAGRDLAVDAMMSVYGEVVARHARMSIDPDAERRAASAYFRAERDWHTAEQRRLRQKSRDAERKRNEFRGKVKRLGVKLQATRVNVNAKQAKLLETIRQLNCRCDEYEAQRGDLKKKLLKTGRVTGPASRALRLFRRVNQAKTGEEF